MAKMIEKTIQSGIRQFAACLMTAATTSLAAAAVPAMLGHVDETKYEFLATGDFDGNGHADMVVVEKKSGKYRLGYQAAEGQFNWVSVRKSDIKNVTGVAVGRLLKPDYDAMAFSSSELNQINVLDAHSQVAASKPVTTQTTGLGPTAMAAVDIGGDGNTPLHDLYVATVFNDPDPHVLSLLRAKDGDFAPMDEDFPQKQELARANPITLTAGGSSYVAVVLRGKEANGFRMDVMSSGKPVGAVTLDGLPVQSEYLIGRLMAGGKIHAVFYGVGGKQIVSRAMEESGGKITPSAAQSFEFEQPVRQAWLLPHGDGSRLLVVGGEGEQATIYSFDGTSAPKALQSFAAPTNEYFSGAFAFKDRFVLLSGPSGKGWSSRYHRYNRQGEQYEAAGSWDLPTLDEVDVMIHARLVANQKAATEADMKAYTNRIPGTAVTYVMLPIPGGEFVMGSPEGETNRNADEGPQHKVKISPFWMGRCEVTWNEFELFMYPDEEKKFRANNATDAEADALADVVARPTKPYVEMSFGMGKDGYPAIAMTQHAANKYCQWLSAKTGHFYRLPTEAEWEYACRAGTTTTYSFGDDVSKLGEHAWYEDNSDFKYHKVGIKKPNPWGLHDIHGNVLEWCLDQYETNYMRYQDGVVIDPWNRATKPYPHSARGGSYDDEKTRLRSAARRGSERAWKMQDPQLPKSVWYFSDAPWVGLRLVRPLKVPSPEELSKYWTSGVERD